MGEVIVLAERRASRPKAARATFYFDLACPFSYLAAERIERQLGEVEWIPVAGTSLTGEGWARLAAVRAHAETRAVALRLPLVWPDRLGADASGALRAAAYAAEIGVGARFALAASRLAFCGGFDLDDPEILAEAAAAAGIPLDACLAAARDQSRDEALYATAAVLVGRGIDQLPAVRVGRRWFHGEQALAEASAALRAGETVRSRQACVRPLTPATVSPLAPAS